MIRYSIAAIAFVLLSTRAEIRELRKFSLQGTGQGTTWQISYYAMDSLVSAQEIYYLLAQVDSSLSVYKPYSLISTFNKSARGLEADQHLKTVVRKAIETYKDTRGLFDITIYPLTNAWGFADAPPDSFPGEAAIEKMVSCISTSYLQWRGSFLSKKKACVQLDPNGIAQGYTVDLMAKLLDNKGITTYVAELGGELRVKGRKPDGSKMTIGIESPGEMFAAGELQTIVYIEDGALTTSGSYRRYVESGGKKITHLLDPKTGRTIRNELLSVTVFAENAITADAYDNALMMMGLEKAMNFVEQRPGLAAHFIYFGKEGIIADTCTSRFKKLLLP